MSNPNIASLRQKGKNKSTIGAPPELVAAYHRALAQLQTAEGVLAAEGVIITVPIFSRSGAQVGTKRVRHPMHLVMRNARSDVIRLAKLLGVGQKQDKADTPDIDARQREIDQEWDSL